ncbi:MAG: CDP-alcohol phosphatidyltransferase family protein [archaeon]
MLGKYMRKRSKKFFLKVGKVIGKTGITPNMLTFISLLFALVTAFFIARGFFLWALLFFVITGFMDIFDGAVARATKKTSNFGNYFDAVADRYVEIIILAGFAFSGFGLEAFLAITGAIMISYTKARVFLVVRDADNHDWPSVGERVEKGFMMIAILLLARFLPFIGTVSVVSICLYILAGLMYIGAIQRIFYAKKLIND